MPVRTAYEWIVEDIDECGDIIDCSQWNTAAEALREVARPLPAEVFTRHYGATRQRFDVDTGEMVGRSWAYVDARGNLPERFTDGDADGRVPQRLVRELRAAATTKGKP